MYVTILFKILLQDKLMGEIHACGKTIADIEDVLKRVPIHPRVVPAIKTACALGYAYDSWTLILKISWDVVYNMESNLI